MRRTCCCVLLLIFLFVPAASYAHSGNTDSAGGHYMGGDYHYHHGYPAHEHKDGVCPYSDSYRPSASHIGYHSSKSWGGWPYVFAFGFLFAAGGLWLAVGAIKDKVGEFRRKKAANPATFSPVELANASLIREGVGQRSQEPTNNAASLSSAPYASIHRSVFSNTRSADISRSDSPVGSQAVEILRKAMFLFQAKEDIVHCSLRATSVFDIKVAKALLGMYQRNDAISSGDNSTACAIIILREIEAIRSRASIVPMLSMDATRKVLSRMPLGTIIGSDMLPREEAAQFDWGDKYTVYTTQCDRYHHSLHCTMGCTPVHVCNVHFSPCPACRPERPDLSWYYEYAWICDMRKKYGLDKSDPLVLVHGREVRRPTEKSLGPGGE